MLTTGCHLHKFAALGRKLPGVYNLRRFFRHGGKIVEVYATFMPESPFLDSLVNIVDKMDIQPEKRVETAPRELEKGRTGPYPRGAKVVRVMTGIAMDLVLARVSTMGVPTVCG